MKQIFALNDDGWSHFDALFLVSFDDDDDDDDDSCGFFSSSALRILEAH